MTDRVGAIGYDVRFGNAPVPNAVTTSLFQTEYLQALEDWLRRRFRLLCLTCIGLATLDLILTLAVFASTSPWAETAIDAADDVFTIAIVGRFAFPARWRSFSRPTLLRYASRMMLTLGAMMVALQYVQGLLLPDSGASMLAPLFVLHFIACLFLPWKPMESLRPFAPLLVVWAIGVLVLPGDLDWPARIMYAVLLGPAVLVPGLVICGWRLGRHRHEFRLSMVNKHFLSMRQEVGRARAIHETLFPDRWDDGYVRFEYAYAPMRELGGDYVHLLVDRAGGVHLTLLDVTGHGLAAALTVNRLSGEIERLRAERPDIDPDALLVALNRYVHLTLRRRHVFATAFCASLDPSTGHLAWANAGHPPAFLRRADGRVEELAATGVLLGALEDDDFVPRTTTLDPGDVLVVYTDGVFEARNRRGQALGLAALRELMQRSPPPRDWTVHLDTIVRAHVAGQPDDDVLIASLAFLKARPAIEADDHEATMTTATTEAAS